MIHIKASGWKRLTFAVLALALATAFYSTSSSAAPEPPSYPGGAAQNNIPISYLASLIPNATLIASGTVQDIRSSQSGQDQAITSQITFAPASTLKGSAPTQPITLTLPGGRLDNTTMIASHAPSFSPGESAVLFLNHHPNGQPYLVNNHLGKLSLDDNSFIPQLGIHLSALQDFIANPSSIPAAPAPTQPEPQTSAPTLPGTASFKTTGVHWPSSASPIPYYVNPNNGPANLPSQEFISAANNAFKTWQDTPSASISFSFGGVTPRNAQNHFDGFNDIAWGIEPGALDPNTLAVSIFVYDDEALNDVDIQINSERPWFTDGTRNPDLETTLLHEIGHLIGLDHSSDSQAVMYPYYLSTRRSLGEDDIAGVTELYPDYPEVSPTPSSPALQDAEPRFHVWLTSGWNIVQYSGAPMPPEDAFASCKDLIEAVLQWSHSERQWSWWFNETETGRYLTGLIPGAVLWVKASHASECRQK